MNASRNTTPVSPAGARYTYPELVFCTVGFLILAVVAIAGNTLVLVAVARNKKLRNVTNVFVVNLSISDSLSGFAILWSVPGMVSKTPGYPWSNVPCVAAAALVFITVGSGIYTLANIALNRCILITRPKETFRWLYSPRKIAVMVLGSWLVPLCAIVVPPLCGVGDVGFDRTSRTCTDIDANPSAATYGKIQFAVFYPLPLAVILVSYALIWRYVRRHFKKRRRASVGLPSSRTIPSAASAMSMSKLDDGSRYHTSSLRRTGCSRHVSHLRNDELSITKNLFAVVLVFLVCVSPICLMVVSESSRYQLYGGLVLYVSCCINPIIYGYKHPHFRPVLRSMLRCRCTMES